MAKPEFWRSDWFLGVEVALAVLVLSCSGLVQSLERKAYDMGVRAWSRSPRERVAVTASDDASIANIGRWPWHRDVHAKLIDGLKGAQAKVIGYTAFLVEAQIALGVGYLAKLKQLFGLPGPDGQQKMAEFGEVLPQVEGPLATDGNLGQSVTNASTRMLDGGHGGEGDARPLPGREGTRQGFDGGASSRGSSIRTRPRPASCSAPRRSRRRSGSRATRSSASPICFPWACPVSARLRRFAVPGRIHGPADAQDRQPTARRPTVLNPALPDCLLAIFDRALAKDKEQRYRSGDETARELRECADALGAVDVSL